MFLTVFTPTYNRAYILSQLYNSLLKQQNKDFLWLVIDDGSSDETENLINGYIKENKINIKYAKQKNSGKHIAHNNAVELCDTELFVCVDSDDYITDNAVEIICNNNEKYKNDKILGFYYKRKYLNGENITSDYPKKFDRCGIMDIYHNYKFSGDTMIVLKASLLKEYKFPVFDNEKFVTERVFYNLINDIAPMILCDEALTVCEYLPDGYTLNGEKLLKNNPYGFALDFLFESYYGKKFLYKVKNYTHFLIMKNDNKLNVNKLGKYFDFEKVDKTVKFASRFFILPGKIYLMIKHKVKG